MSAIPMRVMLYRPLRKPKVRIILKQQSLKSKLPGRSHYESNVESLLKAKGFKKALAIISDGGVSIVVSSEGLTSAQTLQIQDIVTSETGIALSNIKIIPVA